MKINGLKNNNKGFSLIELMVVVAIIGILATIAMPNYQNMQARSKQTESKTELASVFTSEKAFFAEYSTFHSNLSAIGYVPESMNVASLNAEPMIGSKKYYGLSVGNDPALPVTLDTLSLAVPAGNFDGMYRARTNLCIAGSDDAVLVDGAGFALPVITNNTFTIVSVGCPKANVLSADKDKTDIWTIDQNRVTANVRSGI